MKDRSQFKAPTTPWFAVRKELSAKRRSLLVAASFILPILLWSIVSYTPFIWHPDIKLEISADRENVTTVFTAGNHLSKEYYPSFVEAVEAENTATLAQRESGESTTSGFRARRANLKILRHIAPVATANGWLSRADAEEDSELYKVWQGVAEGTLIGKKVKLSEQNIELIKRNWGILSAKSPTFVSKSLPETPLEKLVPQGRPANPVYLPAPHEVVIKGYQDFTKETDPDKPSMWQRYKHSLQIVFFGFILSALVGVPLGILCGTFDFFSKLFEPFIDFFRYMPAPAFSTLLVAVFLAHDAPKIALVFLGTFFQMVLVVSNTTRQLDASLIEAAQTLGAKTFTMIRRVIVPGITPNLYNDMRILLGWSWTWLVIAELIGVKSGLTEFIETQGRWRNFDSVFPIIIMIGVTGFVTDQILASLRKYFFPWTPESTEKKHGFIGRFVLWMLDRKVYDTPKNGKA
ncbi:MULTISPECIES: ABC transporter permease [unclassified Lentimonas]|uniref:ABC transporter permease n=1 Tax=unclassified Lentimonas TaxID=2630993 RepID=UPI00132983D0|nr:MULTISPECIES: ABC transporter permease [unclassified Lentimonas]CAA6676377.1 Urea carboxylase-related ABC transporter, permease protein [Lentimonas sp. CC4]CAA6685215.1 Urea carboxylase-related ABC transporter, permease protein [Lentimonas sp. CC6]CAA7075059.1 Urea carboxylase-related ABC transporter, permease protein [Lentimonas sp. CC4]CAA7169636.1 Urea carboxylase-related ABC transporter, permease protein [Lentimonas sp. CC21]CAA7182084.1 Urea carboxylase-related ABC transporter, permeas